jgi:D-alanyl-D-alanine carboxypeptidase
MAFEHAKAWTPNQEKTAYFASICQSAAMTNCTRVYLRLGLTLAVANSACGDAADDYLKAQMASHQIPGVALIVIQNGKPIKTAAYGEANLELRVSVRPETVFEIGSITKQFTAAGILLLAQDGKLSIDAKVTDYLKSAPQSWTNITLRHLLTHTSGLKNYTVLDGFELSRHLTQEQFIKAIAAQPRDFAPGESWKYCNTGFNLLGFVIENVSGKNYWDFMSERVFRPLGMTHTTDRGPGRILPNRASGYEQNNYMLINRDYNLTDVFSAGAIASTVLDLAKWNAALDGDELLNPATKALMWTPTKLNNGKPTKYGFAWFIDTEDGHKNIGHSGSTSGFSASLQRYPDDHLAVILLTNTDEQIATTLAKKIATFYFAGGSQPGQ